jgi:hypothetical protein
VWITSILWTTLPALQNVKFLAGVVFLSRCVIASVLLRSLREMLHGRYPTPARKTCVECLDSFGRFETVLDALLPFNCIQPLKRPEAVSGNLGSLEGT